jgi:hypothetical protein
MFVSINCCHWSSCVAGESATTSATHLGPQTLSG